MHPTVSEIWTRYRAVNHTAPASLPLHYCFSDNYDEANELLELVLSGVKQATAPSVAELKISGDPIPKPGDYAIVTNGDGVARAVIRTRAVEIRRFGDVGDDFAYSEGEGDRTLAWWRAAHFSYYMRILEGTDHVVDDNLEIVCEQFTLVYAE